MAVVGREKELKLLTEAIDKSLVLGKHASVYVSGPPGTGKTLCIRTLLDDFKVCIVLLSYYPHQITDNISDWTSEFLCVIIHHTYTVSSSN